LTKDLTYFLYLFIIVDPKPIWKWGCKLCTCSADLSTELGGVELEGVGACVGFDDVNTW